MWRHLDSQRDDVQRGAVLYDGAQLRHLALGEAHDSSHAAVRGAPEAALQGQRICVTGVVSFFRQRPEMILSSPTQVSYVSPQSIAELR